MPITRIPPGREGERLSCKNGKIIKGNAILSNAKLYIFIVLKFHHCIKNYTFLCSAQCKSHRFKSRGWAKSSQVHLLCNYCIVHGEPLYGLYALVLNFHCVTDHISILYTWNSSNNVNWVCKMKIDQCNVWNLNSIKIVEGSLTGSWRNLPRIPATRITHSTQPQP